MARVQFNLLDDSFLSIEQEKYPWNIHMEVHLSGGVDQDRLRQAIHQACAVHPMARASVQAYSAGTTTYFWKIADELNRVPLKVSRADSTVVADGARDRCVSDQPASDQAPLFSVELVKRPEGDLLLVNLNHMVADGISTFRLVNSIIRAYACEADPIPDLDPLSVRDLKKLVGSKGVKELAERAGLLMEHLVRSTDAPVRIQPSVSKTFAAYGCVLQEFSKEETTQFFSRRQKPATVNDMLIAAMLLSIRRWNRAKGGSSGRLSSMMPVNVRPQEWWHEVVGNFSSYVSISLPGAVRDDFDTAVKEVCEQTGKLKETGAAGILIDVLDIPKFLPSILKSRLKDLTPSIGKNLVESTWVSNLGRLESPPVMGDAGAVKAIYFSPPAPAPMGISLGIASMSGQLFLAFRYRRDILDRAAAIEFAELFRKTALTSD